MVMRQEENSLKELEAFQKRVPFAPRATSYRMGWKGLRDRVNQKKCETI
jgi:hypothetical protein